MRKDTEYKEISTSAYVTPGIQRPEPPKTDEQRPEPPKTDEQRLVTAIASEFGIPEFRFHDHISQCCRLRPVVGPRQVVQALVKFATPKTKTLRQVGLEYGYKNHATVLHSCRTIRNQYQTDKSYRAMIDSILEASNMKCLVRYLVDNKIKII